MYDEKMYYDLWALDGVEHVRIIENPNDYEDEGLPPFSIKVIVKGGDDESIARTIFKHRHMGVRTVGNTKVIFQPIWGMECRSSETFERI